jgi:hypothetical protein
VDGDLPRDSSSIDRSDGNPRPAEELLYRSEPDGLRPLNGIIRQEVRSSVAPAQWSVANAHWAIPRKRHAAPTDESHLITAARLPWSVPSAVWTVSAQKVALTHALPQASQVDSLSSARPVSASEPRVDASSHPTAHIRLARTRRRRSHGLGLAVLLTALAGGAAALVSMSLRSSTPLTAPVVPRPNSFPAAGDGTASPAIASTPQQSPVLEPQTASAPDGVSVASPTASRSTSPAAGRSLTSQVSDPSPTTAAGAAGVANPEAPAAASPKGSTSAAPTTSSPSTTTTSPSTTSTSTESLGSTPVGAQPPVLPPSWTFPWATSGVGSPDTTTTTSAPATPTTTSTTP